MSRHLVPAALALLIAATGGYLVYAAVMAAQSGRFVAKSPEHPILVEDAPLLFWAATSVTGLIGLVILGGTLRLVWQLAVAEDAA